MECSDSPGFYVFSSGSRVGVRVGEILYKRMGRIVSREGRITVGWRNTTATAQAPRNAALDQQ